MNIASRKSVIISIQIVFFFCFLLFALLLARPEKTVDLPTKDLVEIVREEQEDFFLKMNLSDEKDLRRIYNLGPSDYLDASFYMPVSNMNVDELLILKLTGKEKRELVRNGFDHRISELTNKFEHYGEDQMALIKKARVFFYGDYAVCVIAEDSDEIIREIKKSIRK